MVDITNTHLELITRIYDVAIDPNGWPETLSQFAGFMDARTATVEVIDTLHAEHNVTASSPGFTADEIEFFKQNYSIYDVPAYQYVANKNQQGFITDYEALGFTSEDEYAAHPPTRYYLETYGVRYRAASLLNLNGAWFDVLALQYSADRGPPTTQEDELARVLLPHFAKAVELGRSFQMLRSRFNAVLQALDHFHIGTFIALGDGQVLLRNREADRILSLADGLAIDRGGRLTVSASATRLQLHKAMLLAASTAQGAGTEAEIVFPAARPSGAESFLLSVSPLRDSDAELDPNLRGAIVFVIDPENRTHISTTGLEKLFGLTRAEADVCDLLLQGRGTREIAEIRGTTVGTVRWQIKCVLTKTRSLRRADLVRLALAVNLPIDDPADGKK